MDMLFCCNERHTLTESPLLLLSYAIIIWLFSYSLTFVLRLGPYKEGLFWMLECQTQLLLLLFLLCLFSRMNCFL